MLFISNKNVLRELNTCYKSFLSENNRYIGCNQTYSEKIEINKNIIKSKYDDTLNNHCNNPSCEFFSKEILTKGDLICPACGCNTTDDDAIIYE